MTEISILVGATIVVVDLAVVALIWQGLRLAALRAGWTRRAGVTLALAWAFAIGLAAWVSFAVVFSAAFIADRPVTPSNGAAFVSLLLTVVICACASLLSPARR